MMDHEVESLAGPRGHHDPNRVAVRHGSDAGLVTLGGCQVAISRPRVRSADRSSEVALSTYDWFSSTELLGRMAMEKMLAKISTRRYTAGLEPVGTAVEERSRGGRHALRSRVASWPRPRPQSKSSCRRTCRDSTSSASWSTA